MIGCDISLLRPTLVFTSGNVEKDCNVSGCCGQVMHTFFHIEDYYLSSKRF
jgi:hypothetical protein